MLPIQVRREPAVVIGILAAVVLAVVQTLVGQGVLSPDIGVTIGKAIDPSQGGWALPILVGLITRFFVYSPPTVEQVAKTAAATGDPEVKVGPP
jgi:hypothetical protein